MGLKHQEAGQPTHPIDVSKAGLDGREGGHVSGEIGRGSIRQSNRRFRDFQAMIPVSQRIQRVLPGQCGAKAVKSRILTIHSLSTFRLSYNPKLVNLDPMGLPV
jgi:hypothetical protein